MWSLYWCCIMFTFENKINIKLEDKLYIKVDIYIWYIVCYQLQLNKHGKPYIGNIACIHCLQWTNDLKKDVLSVCSPCPNHIQKLFILAIIKCISWDACWENIIIPLTMGCMQIVSPYLFILSENCTIGGPSLLMPIWKVIAVVSFGLSGFTEAECVLHLVSINYCLFQESLLI